MQTIEIYHWLNIITFLLNSIKIKLIIEKS